MQANTADLYTVAGAARELGVTYSCVKKQVQAKRIRCATLGDGTVVIHARELQRYKDTYRGRFGASSPVYVRG